MNDIYTEHKKRTGNRNLNRPSEEKVVEHELENQNKT